MTVALSAFEEPGSPDRRGIKLGLFVFWLCLVSLLAWQHAFFRDEIRALSLALQGDNVVEMLKGVHGEGHPALWYLLLRTAYFVVGRPIVLPLVSIAVAAAAALLLVLRSPFRWWMIALLLLSNFLLYEYAVMARNYGISALLLFLLADCYQRHRDRGVLLGILLFLLANTNAHSVILVGAFLLFWSTDILCEQGFRWTPSVKSFLVNATISAAGVAVCIATIYPPFNDAAMIARPDGITLKLLREAVLLPPLYFPNLLPDWQRLGALATGTQIILLMSLVMYGSLLGLIRSPGAFIAGLAALVGLSLFFALIYPGGYRHQALWLVFLISLYWITRARRQRAEPAVFAGHKPTFDRISATGSGLMVFLIALQAYGGLATSHRIVSHQPPLSRARDFGAFVTAHSELRDAIIIADPDFLLEPLPYYIRNRTYLMRERRFGHVVRFTRSARLSISLDDMLATARTLHAESGKPILILLHASLDRAQARLYHEGYDWELRTTPTQVRDFLAATQFLAKFAPALSDETFDVYLFDRP